MTFILYIFAIFVGWFVIGFIGSVAMMAACFYLDKATPTYRDLKDCLPMSCGGIVMPIIAIGLWIYAFFFINIKWPDDNQKIEWWPWKGDDE